MWLGGVDFGFILLLCDLSRQAGMAGRESLVPLVLLTYGSVGRGDLVLGYAGLISVELCAQEPPLRVIQVGHW